MQTNMSFQIRLAEISDAEFILKLRTNPKLNKHIHANADDLNLQIEWLKEYKIRESNGNELYFICMENGHPVGTYRIVNINSFSFTIGSWVFDKHEHRLMPKIVDLLMSDFGFTVLRKPFMLFDVRKQNQHVIDNQSWKMPTCYTESDLSYYYFIKSEDWPKGKENYMNHYGIIESEYKIYYTHLVDLYASLKR